MDKVIESLLVVSSGIMTAGGALVAAGKVWEGLACVVVSAALIYLRGYFKN